MQPSDPTGPDGEERAWSIRSPSHGAGRSDGNVLVRQARPAWDMNGSQSLDVAEETMPDSSTPPRRLDAFERAYTAGTVAAPPADDREAEREAREGEARAEPGEPFALRGCVLTPDEALEDAFVVVTGGSIAEVGDRRPRSLRVIDTGGVIMPGLIDLHGHPEYNVFAPWEPPRRYVNRYQWRRSPEYAAVVKQPWALLTGGDGGPSLLRTLTRYAEARALVGGTTAIQGASGRYPDPHEALVRNVDRFIFGHQPGRSLV
ncbi:MAG: hypothetical protein M3N00_01315, partial [Actinomycetota bacterium]|nr:hypothetical protein [Actinomycetota bacterium]